MVSDTPQAGEERHQDGRPIAVRRGVIGRVDGSEVRLAGTGAGVVVAGRGVDLHGGGAVVMVAGQDVAITGGGSTVVIAGRDVRLAQAGGGIVVSGTATIDHGVVAILITGATKFGEGGRVLLGTRQAIAFGGALGVALGLTIALASRWLRRACGRADRPS